MDDYRLHPAKVVEWASGTLRPLEMDPASEVTVWVALPPEDGNQVWEGMNAVTVDAKTVELRSVPAFAYNLDFGDHLSVIASAEGPLVCTRIVHKSDQWTFRVWLADPDKERWQHIANSYAQMGSYIDVLSSQLLAISCHETLAKQIAAKLASDERAGILMHETGRQ